MTSPRDADLPLPRSAPSQERALGTLYGRGDTAPGLWIATTDRLYLRELRRGAPPEPRELCWDDVEAVMVRTPTGTTTTIDLHAEGRQYILREVVTEDAVRFARLVTAGISGGAEAVRSRWQGISSLQIAATLSSSVDGTALIEGLGLLPLL
ncbi:MAG: hypothetical protein KC544_01035 [Gemmatimonadetes bacterium]|nr:hypothetical protein [Gemmatimonadota bacterium]MCA9761692.1 hypothetical protein [Gemmatimonadota bacterium]MCB9504585.1 hypothetical protein [Gemmatimonadales bacterium]HPF60695.1 hypothetical protein [Gemmatimonadales bacterium]HRX17502.1 hypothetical protein [Gemmatimonadales bacterium]